MLDRGSVISQDDVFSYIDECKEKGRLDVSKARDELMRVFDLPPARCVELLNKWAKTFQARHPTKKGNA